VLILEDETIAEEERNKVYNRIPSDVVKDPSGLARELKWRVEKELGESGAADRAGEGVFVKTEKEQTVEKAGSAGLGLSAGKDRDRAKKLKMKPAGSRTSGFNT
jgi:F-box/leucine-rich repeat protein 10/11